MCSCLSSADFMFAADLVLAVDFVFAGAEEETSSEEEDEGHQYGVPLDQMPTEQELAEYKQAAAYLGI